MKNDEVSEYNATVIAVSSLLLIRSIWIKFLFVGIALFSPISFIWFENTISWKIVITCTFASLCSSISAYIQQKTIETLLNSLTPKPENNVFGN